MAEPTEQPDSELDRRADELPERIRYELRDGRLVRVPVDPTRNE